MCWNGDGLGAVVLMPGTFHLRGEGVFKEITLKLLQPGGVSGGVPASGTG